MVTILPLAEIDKYVIHDVWGHSWQAGMLQFERAYEELAGYGGPLRLSEQATLPDGTPIAFGDCFLRDSSGLRFDREIFHRFVHAEIAQRLPIACAAALAEMMADVAEYKFVAMKPAAADLMPSSSLFKRLPAKLDFVPMCERLAASS